MCNFKVLIWFWCAFRVRTAAVESSSVSLKGGIYVKAIFLGPLLRPTVLEFLGMKVIFKLLDEHHVH